MLLTPSAAPSRVRIGATMLKLAFLATALLASPSIAQTSANARPVEQGGGEQPGMGQTKRKEEILSLDGHVRIRGEVMDGQYRSFGPRSEGLLLFQTRLSAQFRSADLTVGAEIMDARAYSTAENSTLRQGEVNALEPVQYWMQYRFFDLLGQGTTTEVKLGQQRMRLGSNRLVNSPNHRNTTNAYLGLRMDHDRGEGGKLTAFYVLPTGIRPDDVESYYKNKVEIDRNGFDRQFFGAIYDREFPGVVAEAYVLRLAERDAPGSETRDRRLWTQGMRLYRTPSRGGLDFEVEGILQRGTARRSASPTDTVDRSVRAHYLHGEMGYTLPSALNPRFAAVATYGSGQQGSEDITRFDQLFGAIFPDYAPPGLFGPTTLSNVFSIGADVSLTPGRWKVWGTYRRLRAPEPDDVFGRSRVRGGPNGDVGDQFFIRARRPLAPGLMVELGGAYLLKGDFLTKSPGVVSIEDTRYLYSDLTLTF